MATNIKAPSSDVFTAYSSPYAQVLARRTGNAPQDALNTFALMQLARGQGSSYADLLQQANQQAMQAGQQDNAADISKAYLTALPQLADKGISAAVNVPSPYFTVNPDQFLQSDVLTQNATQQRALGDTAGAIKALTEAGVRPSPEDIGAMITPPIQAEQSVVQPYVSFDSETDRIKANASMINANKPSGGGGGDGSGGVAVSITDDGFGDPSITYRGKDPAAVMRAYQEGRGGTGGTSGTGGTATGGRQVVARDAVIAARNAGAVVTQKGNKITLEFPSGRKSQITVNPDGSGVETRVR